jgi:hypothetical protein
MPELSSPLPETNEPRSDSKSFLDFMKSMGVSGLSERERQIEVACMEPSQLAIFLTTINAFVSGENESNISESTMKIGDADTIKPEDRASVFLNFCQKLKSSVDSGISPERFGDALALATVLLHPFNDGNGRTARIIGLLFRDDFDYDLSESLAVLAKSRDTIRREGGFMVNGYIPYIDSYGDRSDAAVVSRYLSDVLSADDMDLYTGPYGQARL